MVFAMAYISTSTTHVSTLGFRSHINRMGDVLLRAPFFAFWRANNLLVHSFIYCLSFVWLIFAINLASPKLEKRVTALDALGNAAIDNFKMRIFGEKVSDKNLSCSNLDIIFPLTFLLVVLTLVNNVTVKNVLQQSVAKLVGKRSSEILFGRKCKN